MNYARILIFIGAVMDVTLRDFYKIYPVTGITTINKSVSVFLSRAITNTLEISNGFRYSS